MNSVSLTDLEVAGGVDTHQDQHVAAVLDREGTVLGVEYFPTTRHGYLTLIAWMKGFGDVSRVGVECTGSYGAGLTRYLALAGIPVGGHPTRQVAASCPGEGRHLRRHLGRPGRSDRPAGANSQRPQWSGRSLASTTNYPQDGHQMSPGYVATTPQHHRRGPRRGSRTVSTRDEDAPASGPGRVTTRPREFS